MFKINNNSKEKSGRMAGLEINIYYRPYGLAGEEKWGEVEHVGPCNGW